MKAKYTWVIVKDNVLGEESEAIGLVGPSDAGQRAPFQEVIRNGRHFRLLNPWGRAEFLGYVLGEVEGPEPLIDFGEANGCSDIEYERDGRWVDLDGVVRGTVAKRGRGGTG